MKCEIIAIGTELLLGNILNSNAQYISQELANIGINVFRHTVVGDNKDRVKKAIEESFERCDLIITTGGLGPTLDDLSKEAVAEYFNREMTIFEDEKNKLEEKFINAGYTLTDNNYRQVTFPSGSLALLNEVGLAPGVYIEENNKILVMLPGPPHECKSVFDKGLLPILLKKSNDVFYSKNVNFLGIGESALEIEILDLITNQTNPTIAPYAKDGYVSIRITAKCKDEAEGEALIQPVIKELEDKVGQYIFAYEDIAPEVAIVNLMAEKGLTVATAESCTGGLLSSYFINVPNASNVINASYITYSNEAKTRILGVSENTLNTKGAVSDECANEMVNGLSDIAKSDISVAITGIAGPTGGTEDKPIGTVYIAVKHNGKVNSKRYNFRGNRNNVRRRSVYTAMYMILEILKEN